MDPVDPQVDVVGLGQRPLGEGLRVVLPLCGQPGDRCRGQTRRRAQELGPTPGTKSPLDRPCRYSNGNTSATPGDFRAQAGRIAEENRTRSPVASSMRLSFTRGARTAPPRPPWRPPAGRGSRCGPPTDDPARRAARMSVDVGGDLRQQRRRQHLPRPVPSELIEQRPTHRRRDVAADSLSSWTTLNMDAPSRTDAPTPVLISELSIPDLPRKASVHVTRPRPSTVLIIAPTPHRPLCR